MAAPMIAGGTPDALGWMIFILAAAVPAALIVMGIGWLRRRLR